MTDTPALQGPRERPRPPLPLDAADTFAAVLAGRIDQLRGRIPAELAGTLQLEIGDEGAPAHYVIVTVDGPRTEVRRGLEPAHDAWIQISARGLDAWRKGGPLPSLDVEGDTRLARELFGALASAPSFTNPIGIRTGGAL